MLPPLWHPGLTQEQSEDLEGLKVMVCKIAYPRLSYKDAIEACDLPIYNVCRHSLYECLFKKMKSPKDNLHWLLPQIQDTSHTTRNANEYPHPKCHTQRYLKKILLATCFAQLPVTVFIFPKLCLTLRGLL